MVARPGAPGRWRQTLALWRLPRRHRAIIQRVRHDQLTYLSTGKLVQLARLARRARDRRVPGLFVECGCALGGSAIVLAACKEPARSLRVYDVFGMIPPPSAEDGPDVHERFAVIRDGRATGLGGDLYYGYVPDLYAQVRGHFARLGYPVEASGVTLVPGLLQDTLKLDEPVALAHVDVDWYEPVRVSLERLWPRLAVGGAMVFDDYFTYSGCRKAVDAFLDDMGDQVALDGGWGALVITRRR